MDRVLVTGATGRVGREVVSQLRARRVKISALTRSTNVTSPAPAVEVVCAHLTIPTSLVPFLDGIDSVFLVWTAPPATVVPVLERIAKHARRVVFLSAPLKTPHPLFQQPNPARALSERIEGLIETSGLEWRFLRPGMSASNALNWWAAQMNWRPGALAASRSRYGPVDERDIAAIAVRSLCDHGHARAEYVLIGPESLTQVEQISTIGQAIGRSLCVQEMSPEEARREWAAFWPPFVINMLLHGWAAAIGVPAFVTSTFEEITETPARTFHEWATDHASDFLA